MEGTGGCEEVGRALTPNVRNAELLEGGELFRVYLCYVMLQTLCTCGVC